MNRDKRDHIICAVCFTWMFVLIVIGLACIVRNNPQQKSFRYSADTAEIHAQIFNQ